jgi:hypothetical protein
VKAVEEKRFKLFVVKYGYLEDLFKGTTLPCSIPEDTMIVSAEDVQEINSVEFVIASKEFPVVEDMDNIPRY